MSCNNCKELLKTIEQLSSDYSSKIGEVQIIPINPKDGLIGFVSFAYDNAFHFASMGLYTRPDGSGYRLTYPTRKTPSGVSTNVFYPINKDVAKAIENRVTDKYNELMINSFTSEF